MRGCPLAEAYPVVPIADRHALSIGITTVGDGAFFGLYADPRVASRRSTGWPSEIDEAIDELAELSPAIEERRGDPRLTRGALAAAPRVGCRSGSGPDDPAIGGLRGWRSARLVSSAAA